MLNLKTKDFSHLKGKLNAICNTSYYSTIKKGKLYQIAFQEGLFEGEQYVNVYDFNDNWICSVRCARFTLLGEEE